MLKLSNLIEKINEKLGTCYKKHDLVHVVRQYTDLKPGQNIFHGGGFITCWTIEIVFNLPLAPFKDILFKELFGGEISKEGTRDKYTFQIPVFEFNDLP